MKNSESNESVGAQATEAELAEVQGGAVQRLFEASTSQAFSQNLDFAAIESRLDNLDLSGLDLNGFQVGSDLAGFRIENLRADEAQDVGRC